MDNSVENTIFDFFVKSFEEDKYDDVRKFLENYREKIIEQNIYSEEQIKKTLDYIICLDNYSVIKWAAQNSDIEALYLLKEYLTPESLYQAISHNNYEALNLFVTDGRSVSLLGFYDKEVFETGLKFFYDCYAENSKNNIDHNEKNNNFYNAVHNNLELYTDISEDITEQLMGLEAKIIQDS